MRRPKEQIIRINQLNLTMDYLKQSKRKRNKICSEIVEGAFGKMTAPISLNQRAEIMTTILDRSIRLLESEENYEECEILKDVRNTIPKVLETLEEVTPASPSSVPPAIS